MGEKVDREVVRDAGWLLAWPVSIQRSRGEGSIPRVAATRAEARNIFIFILLLQLFYRDTQLDLEENKTRSQNRH